MGEIIGSWQWKRCFRSNGIAIRRGFGIGSCLNRVLKIRSKRKKKQNDKFTQANQKRQLIIETKQKRSRKRTLLSTRDMHKQIYQSQSVELIGWKGFLGNPIVRVGILIQQNLWKIPKTKTKIHVFANKLEGAFNCSAEERFWQTCILWMANEMKADSEKNDLTDSEHRNAQKVGIVDDGFIKKRNGF